MFSASTLAHLQSLCARFAQERPRTRDQVSRAYDLVVSESVWPCPHFEDGVYVLSSDGKTEYQVGPKMCECRAFDNDLLCVHRIARRLYLVALKQEVLSVPPVKKSQPSLQTQL